MPTTDLDHLSPLPGAVQATDLVHVRRPGTGTDYRVTAPELIPPANNQRGGPFFLRTYSPADPNYVTGELALTTLSPALACIGSTAKCEFGVDGFHKEYEAVYSPGSATLCFPTGEFIAGAQTTAFVWALKDSLAAARATLRVITATPSPAFVLNEVGTYTLATVEGFYRFKAPGGTFAVPTGPDDVNWLQVAPPTRSPALYLATGQNADGALTQKAASDELALRFRMRGDYAPTKYLQYDAVNYNGGTYYRAIGGTYTAPAGFVAADWVAFYNDVPVTGRVTVLEASTGVLSPVYRLAGSVLTGYADLQTMITAQTRARVNDGRVGVNAPLGQTVSSNSIGVTFSSISNDSGLLKSIAINAGIPFSVNNLDGFYVSGILQVPVLASTGTQPSGYLQRGTAANVELSTAPYVAGQTAILALDNFQIAAWANPTSNPITVQLFNNSTVPPAPYPDGVTVVDMSNVTKGQALPVALAYAATIALDFNAAPVRTLAATGNVAFTTVNRFAGGLKTVYLKNTTAAAITLSYEAWVVFGTALPTSLAAGKELILTLTCLGTTVSDVKAAAVLSN